MKIGIVRLPHAKDLPLPHYATAGSAGMDLSAAVDSDVEIRPGARAMIPTGLSIELPDGTEAQVRPRSGLAAKHGITVLNTPGTIDSDYRGEIKVVLINLGDSAFVVTRGTRIAQMIIAKHERAVLVESETLSETTRGSGGYGSTGTQHIATRKTT
ncbi:MAG TPA: dUTP diphosphatase [Rhizomicrobium sp.]